MRRRPVESRCSVAIRPPVEAVAAHRAVVVVLRRRAPDDDRRALAAEALEELRGARGGKQDEAVGAAAFEVAMRPTRVVDLRLQDEQLVALLG